MGENLTTAAQNGDINMFYRLLRADPYVLDSIDSVPFIDTPLHTAASFGEVQFAREIMRLKPLFARKLNPDGLSPMHLALQNGRTDMVLGFLDYESNLVRVQGREGRTPLHYVAEQGVVDLLTEFLSACPQSIQDVTIQNETALHIAVKNHNVEALDFLLGGLRRACYQGSDIQETKIINWKDDEGNTVLHVATAMNQSQAVRLLINSDIAVNVKNSMGLTALDISDPNSGQVRETLLKAGALNTQSLPQVSNNSGDHLRSNLSRQESAFISVARLRKTISNDTRNALLVVAALIVTAAFQTALSPPKLDCHTTINNDNNALNMTLVNTFWLDPTNNNNNDNNAQNITLVNTTSRINTTEIKLNKNEGSSLAHQPGTLMTVLLSLLYVILSCSTFYMATFITYVLLPDEELSDLLSMPLLYIVSCYVTSWLITCPTMETVVSLVLVGPLCLLFVTHGGMNFLKTRRQFL